MSKLKFWSDFKLPNDIMHENDKGCGHLDQAHSMNVTRTDTWLSWGIYIIVWRGFWEIIKWSHRSGNEGKKLKKQIEHPYLPAEEYPYLLLRFYDTYYSIRIY